MYLRSYLVLSLLCVWLSSSLFAQQKVANKSNSNQRPQGPIPGSVQGPSPVAGKAPAQGPAQASPARKDDLQNGPPAWFPLPAEQDKYLMDILKYWEHTASKVQRYRCKFMRWEYLPTKLPKHPEVASVISEGEIKYAAPDKGLFKVAKYWDVAFDPETVGPVMKDGKPQYASRKENEVFDEHWICDGKTIFQVDGRNKQVIERLLPPEMQGKQISEGPLPFLFGAKVQKMREDYWIRVILPPPRPGRFWLEAIPKKLPQAADFRAIHVVIDEKEFLPEALMLYGRDDSRQNYEFQNRELNWSLVPEQLIPWHKEFFEPKVPAGWKLVAEPFQPVPQAHVPVSAPAAAPPQRPSPSAAPRQAARSFPTPMKR